MARLLFAFVMLVLLAMPLASFAASAPSASDGIVSCHPKVLVDAQGKPILDKDGYTQITDLCTFCKLFELVHNMFQFLAFTIAPALAVVVFLIGGFLLMFGGASEQMKSQGKTAIRGAVIGIVIILLSWVLVNTVINVLTDLGGQNNNGFPWPWDKPSC